MKTFEELKSRKECKHCPYRTPKFNHCGTCPITEHEARVKARKGVNNG